MNFKLKEILIEGKFGPISLGDSKEKVLEVLGKPDDVHGSLTEGYSGVFYGDVEVFFNEDALESFHIHRFEGHPKFSDRHDFDPWIIKRNMPLWEFVETLNREEIPFEAFFWKYFQRVIEIRIHQYTNAVFDGSESPEFQLEHVNLSILRTPNLVPILSLEEYL
jgi:hypothetical protein